MMFQRCLTYILNVILTDEHSKKAIQVSSIKDTHIHLMDFITVYLTDVCVLVYVSFISRKAIDECNAMIQSMNSKISNDTRDEEDLILAFLMKENPSWALLLLFEQYKTPAVA